MDYSRFKKSMLSFLKTLVAEESVFNLSQTCAITIVNQEIYILHLQKKLPRYQILLSEKFQFDNVDNLPAILTNLIRTYRLFNIPTYYLLQPDDYQLFLIESLPVPKDELLDALNWRVRSLINYPIQDATVDYFQIPAKKSAPDNPLIAAIAVKSALLRGNIDLLKNSQFSLSSISIPELALKKISSMYETDDKSSALLYFYGNSVLINITKNKTLYFTRRINLVAPIDPNGNHYEQLAHDLVRYFDYFQSQWRSPTPSRVFVHASKEKMFDIIKSLSEFLNATIEPLELKNLNIDAHHEIDNNFLLLFGALLEEDKENASAN